MGIGLSQLGLRVNGHRVSIDKNGLATIPYTLWKEFTTDFGSVEIVERRDRFNTQVRLRFSKNRCLGSYWWRKLKDFGDVSVSGDYIPVTLVIHNNMCHLRFVVPTCESREEGKMFTIKIAPNPGEQIEHIEKKLNELENKDTLEYLFKE